MDSSQITASALKPSRFTSHTHWAGPGTTILRGTSSMRTTATWACSSSPISDTAL